MATIKKSVYDLCKSVIRSPDRRRLQELISSINRATPGIPDRSDLGYFARTLNIQFLGYLSIDDRRDVLQESGIPLGQSAISEEERAILVGAHQAVVELNRKCVKPLTRSLPYDRHVDPYALHAIEFDEAYPALRLYDPIAARAVVAAFKNHPALTVVTATFSLLADRGLGDDFYDKMLEAVVKLGTATGSGWPHGTAAPSQRYLA